MRLSSEDDSKNLAGMSKNVHDDDNDSFHGLEECAPTAKAAYDKSGDIAYYPGTALPDHYRHNGDDTGDRVAKKIKEEEKLKKYHSSVMKPDETKNKRDLFFVWMCLLSLVFIGLVVFGFVSGLFLPSKGTVDPSIPSGPDMSSAERQAYMEELMDFYQLPFLEPSSPQEQALQWLSFQDFPLEVPLESEEEAAATYHRIRLQQRYALVVWYFTQGGPKLWSSINRDASAGWTTYGAGVHECDWHGIDCEVMPGMELLSEQDARVVIGVRLNPAIGVVLTGTSLSSELGLLSNVRRLDFSSQRLEGSIPDEWKAMTSLGKYS